jgi:hypothetical protein
MKLWVDADATPRDVNEIVFRTADRLRLTTVLVANQRVPLPPAYATLTAVRVDGGTDMVDGQVLAAVLGSDEAEALVVIEPLHRAFRAHRAGLRAGHGLLIPGEPMVESAAGHNAPYLWSRSRAQAARRRNRDGVRDDARARP